jgi:hypothetical protein
MPIPNHEEIHSICMIPIGKKSGVMIFNKMVREVKDAHD